MMIRPFTLSPMSSVGATFHPDMPDLMDKDWVIIDSLREACLEQERAETFFPFFQGCGMCHGFIFGDCTDMSRQLGS